MSIVSAGNHEVGVFSRLLEASIQLAIDVGSRLEAAYVLKVANSMFFARSTSVEINEVDN
jgi:hypothetical protein